MDHETVRAWLEDSFFEPRDQEAAVSDHLAGCAACATHAAALRRTALALDLARGPAADVRERVLAAVRSTARPRAAAVAAREGGTFWWRRQNAMRLAAAMLVVGVLGGMVGVAVGPTARPSTPEAQRLANAVAVMAELASEPAAHEMVLHDPSGAKAGMAMVSMESNRMAIFSSALEQPAQAGYGCYVERGTEREWLGPMHFSDGLAFWAGPMDDSGDYGTRPGDMLVVAAGRDAPAMLSAEF